MNNTIQELIKIVDTNTNEETLVLVDTANVDNVVSELQFNIIDAHRIGASVSLRIDEILETLPCQVITPYTVIKI